MKSLRPHRPRLSVAGKYTTLPPQDRVGADNALAAPTHAMLPPPKQCPRCTGGGKLLASHDEIVDCPDCGGTGSEPLSMLEFYRGRELRDRQIAEETEPITLPPEMTPDQPTE